MYTNSTNCVITLSWQQLIQYKLCYNTKLTTTTYSIAYNVRTITLSRSHQVIATIFYYLQPGH